jgi:peptidoglycan/xylan/chitin deacetylase (PgdA/CDA1 family)
MRRCFLLVAALLALGTARVIAAPSPAPGLPSAFIPPPILMYHRVDVDRPGDAVGRELTVSPEQFEAQLAYLQAHGMAAISMAQFEERLRKGLPLDRTVVMTFDDGYANQYTYALPLLLHYGDSATFYIITGTLGRHAHLNWNELYAMRAAHMDIGAHGVSHDDLSKMNDSQQTFEIDGSIRTLEQGLRAPIDSYAFPSGRFNAQTLRLLRRAGIPFAVTTDPRYVIPPENRLELTRVRVRGDWGIDAFASALRGALAHSRTVQP